MKNHSSVGKEVIKLALPLIIIAGPTAVGKSDVAAELAKRINGEIISADSMQIYKLMDIGTNKPPKDMMAAVKHHFIDIKYPDEEYSVALYRQDAAKVIGEVYNKSKLPIMVGGTGLYINSVINNLDFSAGPDYKFRKHLDEIVDKKDLTFLYNALLNIDPITADKIDKNDKKRIVRALEVYHTTGHPISVYKEKSGNVPNDKYNLFYFVLNMSRDKLYKRIEKRVDVMIQNGLIKEVKMLLSLGYDEHLNSMQAIGYKEIISYLKGRTSLEESILSIKKNTRHYAKRQLTWFKKDKRIEWINIDNFDKDEIVKNIIEKLAGICK